MGATWDASLRYIGTITGDDDSLEWRSYYKVDVGRPSFEQQKEVNGAYARVATLNL
jgi:predicted nucleotidyltransferase